MLQQLAGVRDDAIVEVGLQDGDPLVTVGSAHADVVEPAPVAQRDRAPVVEVVVTDLGLGEDRWALKLWGCLVERARPP
jgi:hypothetical protein